MSIIEKSINVDVPVRTAYDQWTQFEEFPEFMEHVEHVRQVDTTTLRWKVKIGNTDRTFDSQITEQTPDQRIAWKATGDAHHAGVVTFHHLDDEHTRIMLAMEIEPTDWIEKVGDFFGAYSASVEGDLERFKELIEERGASSGSWRGTIDLDGTVTEPGDAEPRESESRDRELGESESRGTAPRGAEPLETEPRDAESLETEPRDAEPRDAESRGDDRRGDDRRGTESHDRARGQALST